MGAVGRLLEYKPLYNKEIDALQRRLFAFPDIMFKHDIGITDVRDIRTTETKDHFMSYLRTLLNEFTGDELTQMFY